MTCISIVNRSNLVTDDTCRLIATACDQQLTRHVCPSWGLLRTDVVFVARSQPAPVNSYPIYVFDDPDIAGVLGYHAEDPDGRPYGRAFVRPILSHGGGVLVGNASLATIVSHEVIEALIDPSCQLWAERGDGSMVAYECCDPVEGQSYTIDGCDRLVSVANFVLPAWFDADERATKYDWLSTLTRPFQVGTQGYAIIFDGPKLAGAGHATFVNDIKPFHPAARSARRDVHLRRQATRPREVS